MTLTTNIEQLKGKTIDDAREDANNIIIKFTDGTACKIIADRLDDDYWVIAFDHHIFGDLEKLFLGMITLEEIDERNKKQEEQNNRAKIAQEYQQYQQLKARFEGKTFQEIKEGN